MSEISKITLPNGEKYDLKDTTARNAANSAVPNTRTVNGKALSSNISLGAGDVGAYTKKETDTKINAAIASAYKYKGSVTADKLPTSGQVVGDVYNITNDSSYGKAGMNVAWNGTTWDALGSNVDLSNYVTTSDSRLSNARPASDVYAWAKAAKKPSYSASEIGAAPASHTHTKAQVGLGSVANLDQSKAIKSITRSGTTFTATALDGTTSIFTQQDINTTISMTILSYGYSSWDDFIAAYNTNTIVYCRASSDSNPASGSQTRMAFMAYVNNGTNPTEVEFQYYRSVKAHSASQQGDQVYIYKLNKTNGWSVIVRQAYSKIIAGTGLTSTYENSAITLKVVNPLPDVTSTDDGKILMVKNGVWGAGSNTINTHISNKSNPHGVTKAQVGLGNVDNVSKSSILQSVYPAGAIYMSMSSTSPASLFGGTWEQLKDRFLLAAGDSYTAGSTGGEATHTLTVNEIPSHSHEVKAQSTVKDSEYGVFSHNINGGSSISVYNMGQTHETGGGQAHNNMPPYLTVYMWKRIA